MYSLTIPNVSRESSFVDDFYVTSEPFFVNNLYVTNDPVFADGFL
jgi:hypothetical protein